MHNSNIIDNGEYAVYVSSPDDGSGPVDASGNWWGVADSILIESLIWHHADNPIFTPVVYVPFASELIDIEDSTLVDVPDDETNLPDGFSLAQNYPNPFNNGTIIEFSLPQAAETELAIYDILGRPVRQYFLGRLAPGNHRIEFDGRDDSQKPLPSGIYCYRLNSGNLVQTRKLVILK